MRVRVLAVGQALAVACYHPSADQADAGEASLCDDELARECQDFDPDDTDGCLKDFSGTGIVGTCASDLRFKKDITPVGQTLGALSRLQPVHYSWRAAEFPEKGFGDVRALGLIAQDVEAVLPELVVTGADGFKAINYSKLPLLTILAVKELKAENDALKDRVTELERLINEVMVMNARR